MTRQAIYSICRKIIVKLNPLNYSLFSNHKLVNGSFECVCSRPDCPFHFSRLSHVDRPLNCLEANNATQRMMMAALFR